MALVVGLTQRLWRSVRRAASRADLDALLRQVRVLRLRERPPPPPKPPA